MSEKIVRNVSDKNYKIDLNYNGVEDLTELRLIQNKENGMLNYYQGTYKSHIFLLKIFFLRKKVNNIKIDNANVQKTSD